MRKTESDSFLAANKFCYCSFSRSPNSPGFEVTWPKFTEEEQEYLVISLKPRVERRYKADKIAFWNEIVPKMIEFIKKKESGGAERASKDEL